MIPEQIGQRHVGTVLGDEVVVTWNLATQWKAAAERGDSLLVASQRDLLCE